MADITLTFEAIGAEKIATEVKKIQTAINDAAKGFGSSFEDAVGEIKNIQTAVKESAESFRESLSSVSESAAKIAEEINEIKEAVKDASEEFDSSLSETADETADSFEDLGEDVDDASDSVGKMQRTSASGKAGLVALGAAVAVVTAALSAAKKAFDLVVDGIHDAFKAGAEFSKMAASLGVDAGQAQLLSQAFAEAGMSAQSVVPMVSKMQRKIAEGSVAFKALGIDVEALKGKSAIEQMEAIGDAVRKVGDQEGKMKVLMAIFEEAGPQLSKFFDNPDSIKNASETLGSSVEIMSQNAEAFDRASVLIGNIGVKMSTFFQGVASGVVGPLNALLEALNKIDLAEMGKKFGDSIGDTVKLWYKAFTNGQLFELIYTKLAAAVTSVADDFGRHVVKSLAGGLSAVHGVIGGTVDWAMGDGKSWTDSVMSNYNQVQDEAAGLWDSTVSPFVKEQAKAWAKIEQDLIKSINRSVPDEQVPWAKDAPTPKEEKSNFNLDLSGLGKTDKSEPSVSIPSDALQRVGGSIGGMTGAAIAPAKKTADNTSRLVGLTNEIRTALKGRSGTNIAVFA